LPIPGFFLKLSVGATSQVDVVTDSPIDTIKTNQIPFIQSLADALGVSPKQVYWFNLTESDLNTVSWSNL
jgi:hypothetical protein